MEVFNKIRNLFGKSIFENSKYLILSSIIDKFFYFLFFVVIARKTSIENYGIIVTYFATTFILLQLTEFGLNNYVQKFTATSKLDYEKFSNIFSLRLFFSIIIFSVPFLFYNKIHLSFFFFLLLLSFFQYSFSLFSLFLSYYLGINNYRKFLFLSLLLTFPRFFLLVLLLNDIINLIIFQTIASIILLIILLFEYKSLKNNLKILPKLDFKLIRNIFNISLPISLGLIFVKIYDRIDIIFIEKIIGLRSVAIYGVAYSIYKLSQMFSSAVLTPIYSEFSKSYSMSKTIDSNEVKSVIKIFIAFIIFYYLFIFIFGEYIIVNLWGDDYFESYKILILLLFAMPFLMLNNFTGVILNAINKEKYAMFAAMTSAFLGFILYPILVYYFGLLGAIISTIFIELMVLGIQTIFIINSKIMDLNEILFLKSLRKT